MPSLPLLAEIVICTLEGGAGTILNLFLLFQLLRTRIRGNDKLYRYPIYVSSGQGFLLCLNVTLMSYVFTVFVSRESQHYQGHIFRERTMIVVSVGPLVPLIPIWICDFILLVVMIVLSMMYTLIPTTSILQYLSLTRSDISTRRRLILSFSFVTLSTAYLSFFISDVIPSPLFRQWMDNQTREVLRIDDHSSFLTYGATLEHTLLNNNRSLINIVIYYVCLPYGSSYILFISLAFLIRRRILSFGSALSQRTVHMQKAFFTMQILQGFLPLAILTIPFIVFLSGSLLNINLDLYSIILTLFLWFCPITQAFVQLRFVHQSSSKSTETTTSMSRTSVVVLRGRLSTL